MMGLSLSNDTAGLPPPDLSWTAEFTTGLVQALTFIFYFLSLLGFFLQVVTGITVVRAQYALKTFAKRHHERHNPKLQRQDVESGCDLESAVESSNLESGRDIESALEGQNLELLMEDTRRLVLFSPILSLFSMIAVPTSLYANNVGDVGVCILLSAWSILLIHFANASMIHEYFKLIHTHASIAFGPTICTAREEKMSSRSLKKAYFTALFACSLVAANADGGDDDTLPPRRSVLGTNTRSLLPVHAAGLSLRDRDSADASDTDRETSIELARLL